MAGQTSHDSGLWDFLRKRGVAEENIDRMQQDKIDSSLVREIEDAYLARYIPVYGDRIALRRYCLDKEKQKDNSSRMSLLEKLRKKLKTATAGQDEESEQEPWPAKSAKKPSRDRSKNAVKSSRKIELGWIHEGKQMRKRSGGGTRVLEVSKNSTKTDILSHAKELFFPGGESTKGKWEDFLHDIYDFKESRLDESSTVGELYTVSKFGILRFYLNTTCLVDSSDAEVDRKRDKCGVTIVEQQRQTNSDEHQEKPARLNESQRKQSGTAEDSNVVDLTSEFDNSEVIIGGLVGASSASQLDDTVPFFFSTEDIISVAFTTVSSVSEDDIDYAVHSGGNPHNDPPSEIQLDDAVPVFTAVEEVINDAPSTSTPVSGDHDQHTDDYSSFDAGFDQHHMQMVCPEMPMPLFGQSSWILQQRGRK
ncbi:uncharacterized protein LOC115584345 isoform X3 [Sparus aurata]|uniref:uncharacterized protein LOC115584345 isoform X3 n=1 Tax=Sparus aurata TaxID=8175 RepID=UPI0011C185BB|nr:uncharacterized protein LOC115584345 isoform X3 [Sparus aurata]